MHVIARFIPFASDFTAAQARLARAGFASFVLIGAVQALYGPVLPSVRSSFGLTAATVGWTVGAHYLGSVTGVLLSLLLASWLSARSRLVLGALLVGLGAVDFAVMHVWWWALAGVFCIGLGYGILVVLVNALFAAGFGDRSAALLIMVNAGFGFGAVVGPLLYGLLSSGNFRPAFFLAGVLSVLILPLGWRIPEMSPRGRPASVSARGRVPLAMAGFVALFLLYTAAESDTSGWMATNLVFHGYSQAAAAGLTGAFWTALTVGRLLSVPISLRLKPIQMIAGALTGVIALAVMANLHSLTPIAFVLIGLLLAPIFPVGFAWMDAAVPHARGAAALALLGALAGGLIFPLLVGGIIGASTPDILPLALAAITVLCLTVSLTLPRLIHLAQAGQPDVEKYSETRRRSAT